MTGNESGCGGYFSVGDCDLDEFRGLTSRKLSLDDLRFASGISFNVPEYDVPRLRNRLEEPGERRKIIAEWARMLGRFTGVLVLRSAYVDTAPIDAATEIYNDIIVKERESSGNGADHFATAGANDRIWNSLQKLCERDPRVFARYFGNAAVAAVCEAWLGPNYQMTAQINVVRPGGTAQQAHRDYHLGFQTEETASAWPAHTHDLSAALTLQGAIAHTDMPLESGPTKLLPFSQLYRPGYVAWRRDDFRAHFEENHVQVPLAKGDAVFFNPALFHAAGANYSADIQRMANLLQVSSAFGRAMESVNRLEMCRKLYPALAELGSDLPDADRRAAIAACAEGYSFPTNLDTDPPAGGLAPETQAALMERALSEGWSAADACAALETQAARQEA